MARNDMKIEENLFKRICQKVLCATFEVAFSRTTVSNLKIIHHFPEGHTHNPIKVCFEVKSPY